MSERSSRHARLMWVGAGLAALGVVAMIATGPLFVVITTGPLIVVNRPDPAVESATTQASPRAEHPLASGSWDLVLGEEFSAGELDGETWALCHWWDDAGCTIVTNDELQWYLPDNVAVSDGVLTLSALREEVEGVDGRRFDFSSGMVSTGPETYQGPAGLAFTYGYIEMRARVPSGKGLWPAFWMLPETSEAKPEIDIMEMLGDDPTTLRVRVHTVDPTGTVKSHGATSTGHDLTAGWHVYALWWTADEIVWYLDGAEVWRYDGTDIPTEPMYLVANLAVGGKWPGTPDPATVFPATYEIDFIRIWQQQ